MTQAKRKARQQYIKGVCRILDNMRRAVDAYAVGEYNQADSAMDDALAGFAEASKALDTLMVKDGGRVTH